MLTNVQHSHRIDSPPSFRFHLSNLHLRRLSQHLLFLGLNTTWRQVRRKTLSEDSLSEENRTFSRILIGTETDERFQSLKGVTDEENATLNDLSIQLLEKYNNSGTSIEDLTCAVQISQGVIRRTSKNHPSRSKRLNNLSIILRTRFESTGAIDDLDAALEAIQEAIELSCDGDPHRAARLRNLRLATGLRYQYTESIDDINRAVEANLKAIDCCSDISLISVYRNDLSEILRQRFEAFGSPEDLKGAVNASERALLEAPPGDRNMALYHQNLASTLLTRYRYSKQRGDLDKAIEVRKEALKLVLTDSPARANILNGLGLSLAARARVSGSVEDLSRAISIYQEAISQARPNDGCRPLYYNNLGIALEEQFKRTGSIDCLNKAIQTVQHGIDIATLQRSDQAACLHTLSSLLRLRFYGSSSGVLADLKRAVATAEESLRLTPKISPSRGQRLNACAAALIKRFDVTGDPNDLNNAISHYEEAVDLTSVESEHYLKFLSNLGVALRIKFEKTKSFKYLQRAIEIAESVLHLTQQGDCERSSRLFVLAVGLRARYQCEGSIDDLNRAVDLAQDAIDSTPPKHVTQTRRLMFLSGALLERYLATQLQSDLERAISGYEDAMDTHSAPPTLRISTGINAARLLESLGRDDKASDVLARALQLLPSTSTRAAYLEEQQATVSEFSGLASLAATLALISGCEPGEAAVRLDFGRGVILGRLLDLRSDIKGLPDHLASRYENLRAALDPPYSHKDESDPQFIDSASEAAVEFEEIQAEIRRQDGFEDFACPITVQDMLKQAQVCPIVLININRRRSDAIIITGTGIHGERFTDVRFEDVEEQVYTLRSSLRELTRTTGSKSLESSETRQERVVRCEDKITSVLEWLWDAIAEPILQKLEFVARPGDDSLWPRIVLCPTGLLTYLPIHAAGYHRETSTHRTVIDRVISSYTSTIRLLKDSRAKVPDSHVAHKALIASVPQKSLPMAEAEAAVVKQRIRRWLQVQHIQVVKDVTTQTLRNEIPDKTIVHFVCHATSDSNPSSSRLLLSDGNFRVAEIAHMNLQHGALAYLSACSTAFSEGRALDDECITLSAAFQVAGFARVIGTLWDAEDRISLAVAQTFYGGLDNDLSKSSTALHHAVRRVRELHMASPSLWAPYVYFGA